MGDECVAAFVPFVFVYTMTKARGLRALVDRGFGGGWFEMCWFCGGNSFVGGADVIS